MQMGTVNDEYESMVPGASPRDKQIRSCRGLDHLNISHYPTTTLSLLVCMYNDRLWLLVGYKLGVRWDWDSKWAKLPPALFSIPSDCKELIL